VHYWYMPDSYDTWIPLLSVDNKEVRDSLQNRQLLEPLAGLALASLWLANPTIVCLIARLTGFPYCLHTCMCTPTVCLPLHLCRLCRTGPRLVVCATK
jgi:hypothetical protein